MPQRGIETGIWSHVDFCGLSPSDKLLFLYLVTSFRGNAAGIYRVTVRQIAFDTGLQEAEIEPSLRRLATMDIEWFPESQTVWVKRFLAHQAHSPQFLKRVGADLEGMRNYPGLVIRYIEYNATLSIPYQYPIYALPPSGSETESVSESVSELGGMGDDAPDGAPTTDNLEDDDLPEMTPLEDELRQLKGWGRFTMDDRAWLEVVLGDYPGVAPPDIRDMATYHGDKKKHSKGQWKSRLRTWARIKAERGGGNGQHEKGSQGARTLPRSYTPSPVYERPLLRE